MRFETRCAISALHKANWLPCCCFLLRSFHTMLQRQNFFAAISWKSSHCYLIGLKWIHCTQFREMWGKIHTRSDWTSRNFKKSKKFQYSENWNFPIFWCSVQSESKKITVVKSNSLRVRFNPRQVGFTSRLSDIFAFWYFEYEYELCTCHMQNRTYVVLNILFQHRLMLHLHDK